MRSLALGVIADFPPSPGASSGSPPPMDGPVTRREEEEGGGQSVGGGREGVGDRDKGTRGGGGRGGWEEIVGACVQAAGDGYHESPAVVTEALRFLCR